MAISCIYKHPKVPVTEFTEDYLVPLSEKFKGKKRNSSNGGFQH